MKNYKINIIFYNTSTHFIVLYPNRTQRHLKNPYKAHKYRLCRDLPFYSNSEISEAFTLSKRSKIGISYIYFSIYLIFPIYYLIKLYHKCITTLTFMIHLLHFFNILILYHTFDL